MKGKILFKETHGLMGSGKWYFMIIISFGICGMFLWGMYLQLVLGQPWGDQPMSDSGLILTSCLTLVVMAGIIYFITLNRITLVIDEGEISVTFRPYFHEPKVYRKDQIQKAYIRKYKPIFEYGGWGIRIGFNKNKVYNLSGRWGLQLVLDDGKKLLIGTRQHEALEKAIEKFNYDG
jgi:hypothetical protein